MSIPAQLLRLEQLDSELAQYDQQVAELRRRQQGNPELANAEQALASLRAQEQEVAVRQRSLESDLSDLEARITRDHQRLYGGTIVDSRDLASLEKEIQQFRSQRDEMEVQVLEGMERLESLQAERASSEERLGTLRAQWEEEGPALGMRIDELTASLPKLQAERAALAAEIDDRSLNLYGRIRVRSGHAVSTVTDGVCEWCRVVIPPKDVQHARAGSLVTCTNCSRILYAT
jgi:predicted  nucleic acid-binding Zn-ribbon protein